MGWRCTQKTFDFRKVLCLALCLQPPINTPGISLLLDLFALTSHVFLRWGGGFSSKVVSGRRQKTSGKGIRELPVPFVTSQKTDLQDRVFLAHSSWKKKEQAKEAKDGLFLFPRSDGNIHELVLYRPFIWSFKNLIVLLPETKTALCPSYRVDPLITYSISRVYLKKKYNNYMMLAGC